MSESGIGDFERDTRPEQVGEGRYGVTLSSDWQVWGPNGGYVAAIALRAMATQSHLPRVASFHCQFLKAGRFEGAEVQVESIRSGKRSEGLRALLVQDGEALVSASTWMVDEGMTGFEHEDLAMPELPGPDALRGYQNLDVNYDEWFPYWRSVEGRPCHPWENGEHEPGGPAIYQTWMRLNRPPAQFDPILAAARIALWVDLGPWNAAHAPHPFPLPWVAPNLDLHVQFHELAPDAEWLLIDCHAPRARDGLVGTTVRLWTPDGRLVASGGSQLFCRPAPVPPA